MNQGTTSQSIALLVGLTCLHFVWFAYRWVGCPLAALVVEVKSRILPSLFKTEVFITQVTVAFLS